MHENNAILSALRRRTLKHGGALGAWVRGCIAGLIRPMVAWDLDAGLSAGESSE